MILHYMAEPYPVSMSYFDWRALVKFLRDLQLRQKVRPGTAEEKRRARCAGKWADEIFDEAEYILAKRPRATQAAPIELERSMGQWLEVAGHLLSAALVQSPGDDHDHTLDLIEQIHFSLDVASQPGPEDQP
jgi:hypothetical protein